MRNFTFHSFFSVVLTVFLCLSCQDKGEDYHQAAQNPDFLHRSMKRITDVIIHDIFSPPVASRIYVYSSIAAYEVLVNENPEYVSLAGQVNGLTETPKPDPNLEYCFPLAAVQACLKLGQAMTFSEEKFEEFRSELLTEFKSMGIPNDVYERSIAYGEQVGAHILTWSGTDNYKETRTFPKYTVTEDPARWQPTPPDYMDGIEPSWNKIRTMVLDSCNQFAPPPPTPFDTTKTSKFYEELMHVYKTGKELDDEQIEIAKFWDCNPYVSHHKGHVMFATKKITPGGHWIGITAIASKVAGSDIMETARAYAVTSIALFDGFISCWDEKYASNVIRPETAINRHIDPDWRPLLQTPPFPEYTSGHSVISRAAALALTSVYGDNFEYVDSVEVEFGLTARSFKSFIEASEEAAVSRLYGGIHYWPACSIGVEQGKGVGNHVVRNLKFKKEEKDEQMTQLHE